jgi:hypothetical protein
MAKKLSGLGLMILLVLSTGGIKARATGIDISVFYTDLAPYGEWISLDPYGWVWTPYDIAPGWQPYSDGDWVYSDDGWTFVSPIEWGWACYHYGRWGLSNDIGWFWVPDRVWGPAWVAWRYGGDYIGWAPLPPGVGWSFGAGLELGGFDLDSGIGWSSWAFCPVSRFTSPHVRRYIVNPGRNVTLIGVTKNVTNYTAVNNRIVNNNVDIMQIEKAAGRPIPRYKIVEGPAGEKAHVARISGTELQVFRPAISSRKPEVAPKNVLPPRYRGSEEAVAKRQAEEGKKLTSHHYAKMTQLQRQQQQENAPPQGMSQEELNKRHQQEVQALQEQQQKEKQILENRHKREQMQHQANRQAGEPRKQPKDTGKKRVP